MNRARAIAVAAIGAVLLVAGLSAREVALGLDEVTMADAAAAKSDWPLSIAHARAAAEAWVPGSPWPERGWERLEAIGHDAEARGDDETALLAYGAMRAAAFATRGPLSGWESRRAKADEGLARVAAAIRDPAGPRPTVDTMLDALRSDDPPSPWRLYTVAASAIALVAGLARLAWLGPAAAEARVAQAVAAAGLVVYARAALLR
jgi:hypothetical protein